MGDELAVKLDVVFVERDTQRRDLGRAKERSLKALRIAADGRSRDER